MPDILIRGMEMPTQDALLHIHADGRAVFYPFCVLDEVTEYEAIELPPHGDLIDRDALYDSVRLICTLPTDIPISNVILAPVVIPAEEGSE